MVISEGSKASPGQGSSANGWAQSQRAQSGTSGCWADDAEQVRPRANAGEEGKRYQCTWLIRNPVQVRPSQPAKAGSGLAAAHGKGRAAAALAPGWKGASAHRRQT